MVSKMFMVGWRGPRLRLLLRLGALIRRREGFYIRARIVRLLCVKLLCSSHFQSDTFSRWNGVNLRLLHSSETHCHPSLFAAMQGKFIDS